MRRIVFQMLMSLDGFYERTKKIRRHKINKDLDENDMILPDNFETSTYGQVTYRLMEDFGPAIESVTNDPVVAEKLNTLKRLLYSSILQSWEGNNYILLKEFVLDEILTLKQDPDLDIAIFSSADSTLLFIENHLIDEFRIMINPIILDDMFLYHA